MYAAEYATSAPGVPRQVSGTLCSSLLQHPALQMLGAVTSKPWFLFPFLGESPKPSTPSVSWGRETGLPIPLSLLSWHGPVVPHCLVCFVQFSSYLRSEGKPDTCDSILTTNGRLESSRLEPFPKEVGCSISSLLTRPNSHVSLAHFCWNLYILGTCK